MAGAIALGMLAGAGCGSGSVAQPVSTTAPKVWAGVLESRTVITADRRPRSYGLSVPTNASPHPPLLVLVHLLVSSPGTPPAPGAGDATPLFTLAGHRGVAVATPVGLDFSWNGGTCCGTAARSQADDVVFLRAVVDDVASRNGIDRTRVYLVGFSNGGFLAYRMACEQPDLFAGIAVVEGALLVPECAPSTPTNLLVIHQRGDRMVPFNGTPQSTIPGDPVPLPSVRDSFSRYLDGGRCDAHAERRHLGAATTATYRCGDRRARLVSIPGGGHRFPAGTAERDGAGVIARFFGLTGPVAS